MKVLCIDMTAPYDGKQKETLSKLQVPTEVIIYSSEVIISFPICANIYHFSYEVKVSFSCEINISYSSQVNIYFPSRSLFIFPAKSIFHKKLAQLFMAITHVSALSRTRVIVISQIPFPCRDGEMSCELYWSWNNDFAGKWNFDLAGKINIDFAGKRNSDPTGKVRNIGLTGFWNNDLMGK